MPSTFDRSNAATTDAISEESQSRRHSEKESQQNSLGSPTDLGRSLNRRRFLGLAGAGAAVAAGIMASPRPANAATMAEALSAWASGAARTTTSPTATPSVLVDKFPIGLWWPPPPSETTVARYRQLAAAGFTVVSGGNGVTDNLSLNESLLRSAQANNLKALPESSRINSVPTAPTDQQRGLVESALADYGGFESFAGFLLYDEPSVSQFAGLARIRELMRELAPNALPYINLLPTYATSGQLGADTYEEYLEQFITVVQPPFLSFDFYALLYPSGIRPDYFYNWSLIRQAALSANIPAWVFILSLEMPGAYRLPTEAELYWQINVSLSYGCKGIQYFTYWTPDSSAFADGPIATDGTVDPIYFTVQKINQTYLKVVGQELLGLRSESVEQANQTALPEGAVAFSPNAYIAAVDGAPVIVSLFSNPRVHDGTRWLLLTNLSYDSAARVEVQPGPAVRMMSQFQPDRIRYQPIYPFTPESTPVQISLDAGAAKLYRLQTA